MSHLTEYTAWSSPVTHWVPRPHYHEYHLPQKDEAFSWAPSSPETQSLSLCSGVPMAKRSNGTATQSDHTRDRAVVTIHRCLEGQGQRGLGEGLWGNSQSRCLRRAHPPHLRPGWRRPLPRWLWPMPQMGEPPLWRQSRDGERWFCAQPPVLTGSTNSLLSGDTSFGFRDRCQPIPVCAAQFCHP